MLYLFRKKNESSIRFIVFLVLFILKYTIFVQSLYTFNVIELFTYISYEIK